MARPRGTHIIFISVNFFPPDRQEAIDSGKTNRNKRKQTRMGFQAVQTETFARDILSI